MKDFVQDVLFLGINKIDSNYGLYAALMPFINEFMNLFTLTITKPYYSFELYPHHPKTFKERIFKTTIDTLVAEGILYLNDTEITPEEIPILCRFCLSKQSRQHLKAIQLSSKQVKF